MACPETIMKESRNLNADPIPKPFPHIQEHEKSPLLYFLIKDISFKDTA